MVETKNYQEISIDLLVPFKNHPFCLYEGQRFENMVESVRASGILMPIIVRTIDDSKYEILSGHNRVNAAKEAGLSVVPAIVRENLTDDEALFIVTETNLLQRSFTDMKHSERARCLKAHMSAIKKQGKRTDLVNEVERLLNAHSERPDGDETTSRLIGEKLRSDKQTADKYSLSPRDVSRYIRIAELCDELLERVDTEEIGFHAAVSLSYLTQDEQGELEGVLDSKKYSVTIEKAGQIRELSRNQRCTADKIKDILSGDKEKPEKTVVIRMGKSVFSKHFPAITKQEMAEVALIMDKALEMYLRDNPWRGAKEM